jgi:hypothetical protein
MALGAQDIGGKILAIFFPVMAFVAVGFDHVVANMFFLPAAIFAHVPGISWGDAATNWLFAGLGNVVGGGLFVACGYWFLYGRDSGEPPAFAATLAPVGAEVTPLRPAAATARSSRADSGPAITQA